MSGGVASFHDKFYGKELKNIVSFEKICYSTKKKMKIRDILKIINADGWYRVDKGGGSHRQFKHPIKHGRVTISGHPWHDIAPGTA